MTVQIESCQHWHVGPDDIARVTCPIGVTKTSKDPRAIALSVATELVEVMERSGQAGA